MSPKRSGNTQTPRGIVASSNESTPTPSSVAALPNPLKSINVSSTMLKTSKQSQSSQYILLNVWESYRTETPQRVKLIDIFMVFLVVLGVIQFIYVVLAGNYPFNAFLSGFSATVGQFVLTASLRIQTNPENKREFDKISDERGFADFVFGSLLLHFFCVNFIN